MVKGSSAAKAGMGKTITARVSAAHSAMSLRGGFFI